MPELKWKHAMKLRVFFRDCETHLILLLRIVTRNLIYRIVTRSHLGYTLSYERINKNINYIIKIKDYFYLFFWKKRNYAHEFQINIFSYIYNAAFTRLIKTLPPNFSLYPNENIPLTPLEDSHASTRALFYGSMQFLLN